MPASHFSPRCSPRYKLFRSSAVRPTTDFLDDRSPALAAAVIIVGSVAAFWTLLVVRGSLTAIPPRKLLPFAVAGLGNPAAFRRLYFRSIDHMGVRVSAAVVSANPAVVAFLALSPLGEQFTVLTAAGLVCIVAGAMLLQAAHTDDTDSDDLLLSELTALDLRNLASPITAMVLWGYSFVLVKI